MRKHAVVRQEGLLLSQNPDVPLRRIMLHDADGGVFCYLYDRLDDHGCWNDAFFADFADAEEYAAECGVTEADWQVIPDPLPGCQNDWIEPVRRCPEGLEALRGGEWVLIGRPCAEGWEALQNHRWVLTDRWGKHPKTLRDGEWAPL